MYALIKSCSQKSQSLEIILVTGNLNFKNIVIEVQVVVQCYMNIGSNLQYI